MLHQDRRMDLHSLRLTQTLLLTSQIANVPNCKVTLSCKPWHNSLQRCEQSITSNSTAEQNVYLIHKNTLPENMRGVLT